MEKKIKAKIEFDEDESDYYASAVCPFCGEVNMIYETVDDDNDPSQKCEHFREWECEWDRLNDKLIFEQAEEA